MVRRQETTLPLGDKPEKDLYTSKFSFLCQSSLIQRSLVPLLNLCRAHWLFCAYCLFKNFVIYLILTDQTSAVWLFFYLEYVNIWESSDFSPYRYESTVGIYHIQRLQTTFSEALSQGGALNTTLGNPQLTSLAGAKTCQWSPHWFRLSSRSIKERRNGVFEICSLSDNHILIAEAWANPCFVKPFNSHSGSCCLHNAKKIDKSLSFKRNRWQSPLA